jgi:TPR repeat protein
MANPGHTFHNRFANDETITTGKDEEVKDFGFEFKEFSEFSPTLDAAGPFTVQNDKHSESSHVISSAESYTQLAKPEPSHVNALEAAVEQQDDTDNAGTSSAAIEAPQKEEAPPNSTFASPSVPVLSSMSSFQQALDGVGSRSTLPRPPVIDTNVSGSNQPSAALAAASPYSINGLSSAVNTMDMNGRGGRTPESGDHAQVPRPRKTEEATISRPSSFFGLDKAFSGIDDLEHDPAAFPERPADDVPSVLNGLDGAESIATRGRRSSFFGMEQPMGHVPDPDRPSEVPSQAARIAASHRNAELVASTDYHNNSGPQSLADSGHNTGASGSNGATRPGSIAGTISSGPLLDHSHLKPGLQASLLSHNKTLELYRHNAKKTNDPNLIYEFAVFMVDASKNMGGDGSSGGSGAAGTDYTGKEEHDRDEVGREATGLLKKIAERGHMDAQYFLADCYANGIGTPKGKQDFDKAYPLFVLAAKHGHPDAAYRAGTCYEKGWGCRKDVAKALQFYRKAASQTHPGAMYRLATAELNGELGLKKSAREGVKWLKRSAESATPEFPHALHELALLHERGVDNVLFVDEEYSCELLAQAAEMGYAPSAYKLGVNYEYGRMGCPQDGGLSIHMYNIAAQQNHKEACFALTAWYLVGAPGILPQSDTEAYLWAKKAAEQGLAKAEYAVGYFTEVSLHRGVCQMKTDDLHCSDFDYRWGLEQFEI